MSATAEFLSNRSEKESSGPVSRRRRNKVFSIVVLPENASRRYSFTISYLRFYVILACVVFTIAFSVYAIRAHENIEGQKENSGYTTLEWENKVRLLENGRDRIYRYIDDLHAYGTKYYEQIWEEKYKETRPVSRSMKTRYFEVKIQPLRTSLRLLREREDALQNMPVGMPVFSTHVTSLYGSRVNPFGQTTHFHTGIDFAGSTGTPVYATADGKVVNAMEEGGGYGIHVKLIHKHGLATLYAHLSQLAVVKDQNVKRGQLIGYVGSTGLSTGPHLHYEVRLLNRDPNNPYEITFNPRPFIKEQL